MTDGLSTPGYPGAEHLRFWTNRLSQPSFVYVIQGDPGTPIKVGIAIDVEARIRGLQTGNPQTLRLLYVMPGGFELERHLHRSMRRSRIQGEWFAGPEVEETLRFVADLAHQMLGAYDGENAQGVAPPLELFEPWRSKRPVIRPELSVEVPATPPRTSPEIAKQIRAAAPASAFRTRT